MSETSTAADRGKTPTTTLTGVELLEQLRANPEASSALADAERAVAALSRLVRRIPEGDEPGMLHDDEAINWCFEEAITHLQSALWSASGGCYPTALAATRTALGIGLVALEYTLQDADETPCGPTETLANGAKVANTLSAWESGVERPDVAGTLQRLGERAQFSRFEAKGAAGIAEHVLAVDRQLADPKQAHHMQNGFGALHFHERGLTTALEAIREVVGVIGACWVLAYPLVLDELGGTDESRTERAVIFAHPWPASMLAALSGANSSA